MVHIQCAYTTVIHAEFGDAHERAFLIPTCCDANITAGGVCVCVCTVSLMCVCACVSDDLRVYGTRVVCVCGMSVGVRVCFTCVRVYVCVRVCPTVCLKTPAASSLLTGAVLSNMKFFV